MSFIAALTLIIGMPLILLSIGFIVIAVKVFGGSEGASRSQTLESARKLERSLANMENRMGALEDILLGAELASAEATSNPSVED